MSKAKAVEFEDHYVVKTDRTLEENTLRYSAFGFATGATLSFVALDNAFKTTPALTLAGRSLLGYAIPGAVTAALFSSVTSFLDAKRGKKHLVSNAVIGGALAGIFLGSRSLKPWMCVKSSLALGTLAGIARFSTNIQDYLERKDAQKTEAQKVKEEIYMNRFDHLRPKY